MSNRIKHLEMIQNIILRMSNNSFSLKGWTVTLVTGIFALSNKDANKAYFIISYIPVIIFWGLDSYYLQQERLYRELYKKYSQSNIETDKFNLETNHIHISENNRNSWVCCLLSKTEILFYLPLAVIIFIVNVVIK